MIFDISDSRTLLLPPLPLLHGAALHAAGSLTLLLLLLLYSAMPCCCCCWCCSCCWGWGLVAFEACGSKPPLSPLLHLLLPPPLLLPGCAALLSDGPAPLDRRHCSHATSNCLHHGSSAACSGSSEAHPFLLHVPPAGL